MEVVVRPVINFPKSCKRRIDYHLQGVSGCRGRAFQVAAILNSKLSGVKMGRGLKRAPFSLHLLQRGPNLTLSVFTVSMAEFFIQIRMVLEARTFVEKRYVTYGKIGSTRRSFVFLLPFSNTHTLKDNQTNRWESTLNSCRGSSNICKI